MLTATSNWACSELVLAWIRPEMPKASGRSHRRTVSNAFLKSTKAQ